MKHLILFLSILVCINANSQNIGINSTGTNPHSSAILHIDVRSLAANNKKGLIIPEMTTTERDAMPTDTFGLLIFNTTDTCFNYYTGIVWLKLCGDTIQSTQTGCDPGFVMVDSTLRNAFCIEVNERTVANWPTASNICRSLGARLCHNDELQRACDLGSPVLGITGNWEWAREPAGEGGAFRVFGLLTCNDYNPGGWTATCNFRCCYGGQ